MQKVDLSNSNSKANQGLSYSLAILNWVAEFRFISMPGMQLLLNAKQSSCSRKAKRLVERGLLRTFHNKHTGMNKKFFMLTKEGVAFLQQHGFEVPENSTIRVSTLGKYITILHDEIVQEVVLKNLDAFSEVYWDRNIVVPDGFNRPDALAVTADGQKIAIEFERYAKEAKRVYRMYTNHFDLLEQGVLNGVVFYMGSTQAYERYRRLFSEKEWPRYTKDKNRRLVKSKTKEMFNGDSSIVSRKSFRFVNLDI